jgi:hypothetical protein
MAPGRVRYIGVTWHLRSPLAEPSVFQLAAVRSVSVAEDEPA